MKFSALEEYGLRCLLQMARRCPLGSITIPEIARIEGLSVHMVGKMMRILRKGGFVKSSRGQTGGYTLSRSPDQITIQEVVHGLGGDLYDPSFCARHSGVETTCAHTTNCSVRALLMTLQEVIDGVLKDLTLKDLVAKEENLYHRLHDAPSVDENPPH